MWPILKAEFRYTRDALILTYTIAVLFLIAAVLIESWGFYNFMWNTTITYFIFMWIVGAAGINEKRYRLYTVLPVQPKEFAVVDTLYVLIVQLGMSVLWVLYLLFKPDEIMPGTLWLIVANNALILIVITMFGVHYHAGFFETKRYTRLNWLLLVTVIAAIIAWSQVGNSRSIIRLMWQYYASAPVAVALVLVWIGATALSCEVFRRRKSYLA